MIDIPSMEFTGFSCHHRWHQQGGFMRHLQKVAHPAGRNGHGRTGVLDEAKGRLSGLGREAGALESKLIEEVRARGAKILDKAQDKGKVALSRSKTWIRNNPGPAVGAAFLSGAALYAWFGRSKK
jgi:hypothetical protein